MLPLTVLVLLSLNIHLPLAQAEEINEVISNFLEADTLRAWDPPLILKTNYTYYLSGYDDDMKPIWIVEWGHWDVRGIIESGGENVVKFEKYLDQLASNVVGSTRQKGREDEPLNGVLAIVDLADFSLRQMASVPTVAFIIRKFRQYEPIITELLEECWVINTNYIAENMANLIKPVLGRAMDKIEFFGTNKDKWIPRVVKRLPRDQIPEWYGGLKDFKPIRVHG